MTGIGLRVLSAAILAIGAATAIAYAAITDRSGPDASQARASWGSLKPSPLARTEVGAARVGDRIYVVGGFISTGGTTSDVARYDISENRWRRMPDLPIAVNHPGVTSMSGRVYVLGGNLGAVSGREPKSDRLYSFDPRRKRWRRLEDSATERAALGLVGIDGRLYAAGGYSETDDRLRTLEIYDVRRQRWRSGPPMPTGRNHVGAAALDGRLVVSGGRPGPVDGGMTTVEAFDPGEGRWETLPPLNTARSGHQAVAVGGAIVVLGGEQLGGGGQTIPEVEMLEPGGGPWTELPPMVTPRHGLGAAARAGRVYALEGGPQPGLAYSRAVEYLDVR